MTRPCAASDAIELIFLGEKISSLLPSWRLEVQRTASHDDRAVLHITRAPDVPEGCSTMSTSSSSVVRLQGDHVVSR